MKIIPGKPHLGNPSCLRVWSSEETFKAFEAAAKELSPPIKIEPLDLDGETLTIRYNDIFFIEVDRIRTSGEVERLEDLAKAALEDILAIVIPFSRHAPDMASVARLAEKNGVSKTGSLMDFQCAPLPQIKPEVFRMAFEALSQRNLAGPIRQTYIYAASLAIGAGGLKVFATIPFYIWLLFWGRGQSEWHFYAAWFLAGSSALMACCARMNLLMTMKACVAIWFLLKAVAEGGPNPWLAIVCGTGGMACSYFYEKFREHVDNYDLTNCVFDRELVETKTSELAIPASDLEPSFKSFNIPINYRLAASGTFVLWRLGRVPSLRFTSPEKLGFAFLSHRNSTLGMQITAAIEGCLARSGHWNAYQDFSQLRFGPWRDQLHRAYAQCGVFVCVLTREDPNSLQWVRRELQAACLRYHAYGTPVPVIVEAGLSLPELLEMETSAAKGDTPLALVHQDLVRVPWTGSTDPAAAVGLVEVAMKQAVEKSLRAQTPPLLIGGLRHLASQFWIFYFVLLASFFWSALGSGEKRIQLYLTALAVAITSFELGGVALMERLPSWLGGATYVGWTRAKEGWRNLELLFSVTVIPAALLRHDWNPTLLAAVWVGLALNVVQYELFKTPQTLWQMDQTLNKPPGQSSPTAEP